MEIGNMLFGHSRGRYPIDRGKYQDRFCEMLYYAGYDNYGCQDKDNVSSHFIVRPYWWGDGEDPDANLPNFECKELGLEIRWYKYALRDSYSNIPFTDELMEKLEDMVK